MKLKDKKINIKKILSNLIDGEEIKLNGKTYKMFFEGENVKTFTSPKGMAVPQGEVLFASKMELGLQPNLWKGEYMPIHSIVGCIQDELEGT